MKHALSRRCLSFFLSLAMLLSLAAMPISAGAPPVVAEDTTIYYDNSASLWEKVYVNWANPQTNANEVKEVFDTDGDGLYEATIYGRTPSASFGPSADVKEHLLWLGMGGEAIVAGKTYRYVPETTSEDVTIRIPEELPDQEIDAPEGVVLVIDIMEISTEEEQLVLTFDVIPREPDGDKAKLEEPITFRLPVPASVTEGYAKIYHYEELIDVAPILQEYGAKFVEITSKDFSPYSVKPTGHDYVAVVTPPTCTERGYTTYTCSTCGDSYVDDYVDALDHDMSDWIVDQEATCTEPGFTTYTCSACGDSYEADDVAPLGHDMGPWTPIDEELERRECSRCDFTQTRRIGGNILVLLGWFDRGEVAQVITQEGYAPAWEGYTAVTVLWDTGKCLVISIADEIFYVDTAMISRSTFSTGGGGGGGDWTDPIL